MKAMERVVNPEQMARKEFAKMLVTLGSIEPRR
jgi:hypothetical protein